MSLVLITPPQVEPVSLAEAKLQLRLSTSDEDDLIMRLIVGARSMLEQQLHRALITQSWTYLLDRWPQGSAVPLPLAPVQSIDAVRVGAIDGTASTLDPSTYLLDGTGWRDDHVLVLASDP
jgi:uncharacterized phiE125 gp8 family phage protein